MKRIGTYLARNALVFGEGEGNFRIDFQFKCAIDPESVFARFSSVGRQFFLILSGQYRSLSGSKKSALRLKYRVLPLNSLNFRKY